MSFEKIKTLFCRKDNLSQINEGPKPSDGTNNLPELEECSLFFDKNIKVNNETKEKDDDEQQPFHTKNKRPTVKYLIEEFEENRNLWGKYENVEYVESLIEDINSDNIIEILVKYKQETGRDLTEDLKKGLKGWLPFWSKKNKAVYTKAINTINEAKDSFNRAQITAENSGSQVCYDAFVVDEMKKNPNTALFIYNHNSNQKNLIELYYNDVEKNNGTQKGFFRKIFGRKHDDTNLFNNMLEDKSVDMNERIGNIVRMASYIKNTDNNRIKEDVINTAIRIVSKYHVDGSKEIKAHMLENKNNFEVVFNDLNKYLLINKLPNGEIDNTVYQGQTGDCWLLAGVNALNNSPKGREYLKSLIEFNPETGDYTVHLRGEDRSYVISKDELANGHSLSYGDFDMRALEIAFAKYMKEEHEHFSKYGFANPLNGDESYSDLLDKGKPFTFFEHATPFRLNSKKEIPNELVNKENITCVMSTPKELPRTILIEKLVSKSKDLSRKILHPHHGYTVTKIDDKFIYLIDPHNNSEVLKFPVEDAKELDLVFSWIDL